MPFVITISGIDQKRIAGNLQAAGEKSEPELALRF
jgi:hypothetical protein